MNKIKLHQLLRVNHAGEVAAQAIYSGQLSVIRKGHSHDLIKHMHQQELHHLKTFDILMVENRVRPTALMPLWTTLGYSLGVVTAALGPKTAMACTEAVESVIGLHYNNQLRSLHEWNTQQPQEFTRNLLSTIKQFRDDELDHLNTAKEQDSHLAFGYNCLKYGIQLGCKIGIQVAKKI